MKVLHSITLIGLLALTPITRAATITVSTDVATGPGSLTAAILALHDGDTIAFHIPPDSGEVITSKRPLMDIRSSPRITSPSTATPREVPHPIRPRSMRRTTQPSRLPSLQLTATPCPCTVHAPILQESITPTLVLAMANRPSLASSGPVTPGSKALHFFLRTKPRLASRRAATPRPSALLWMPRTLAPRPAKVFTSAGAG